MYNVMRAIIYCFSSNSGKMNNTDVIIRSFQLVCLPSPINHVELFKRAKTKCILKQEETTVPQHHHKPTTQHQHPDQSQATAARTVFFVTILDHGPNIRSDVLSSIRAPCFVSRFSNSNNTNTQNVFRA